MMRNPRIVSLLPSATEIVCALGLQSWLVGRSHECDFPAGVSHLPVLTRARLNIRATSADIDRSVKSLLEAGLSLYEVDAERLRSLRPDYVITQAQCEVCAVTPDDLADALARWTGSKPLVVSLSPNRLDEVWESFQQAADALEVAPRGARLVAAIKARIATLGALAAEHNTPRVACVEWVDPLMAAGNWVPELVAAAGATNLITGPGEHSPWLTPEELQALDPDVIVVMPCGFDRPRAEAQTRQTHAARPWLPPRVLAEGKVAFTDGHQFFNRPGPRLVDSLEILLEIFQSGVEFPDHDHQGAQHWNWITST